MKKEEAIEFGNMWLEMNEDCKDSSTYAFFHMAIKALEHEPCEMTAEEYRQRMIQAFHKADCDELIAICVLPTEKEFEHLEWLLEKHYKAKPEPKMGRWEWEQELFTKNKNWGNWHCSECREIITVCSTDWAEINKPNYKYCPNCGSKMQEVDDD